MIYILFCVYMHVHLHIFRLVCACLGWWQGYVHDNTIISYENRFYTDEPIIGWFPSNFVQIYHTLWSIPEDTMV